MVQYDLPSLGDFIELVKRTDEDADHRLPLLKEAAPLLYAGAPMSLDEREHVAEKFERWRFQRLNKYSHCLSADDRLLVDSLDLAVNRLLHGSARPPKAPRQAIHSEPFGGATTEGSGVRISVLAESRPRNGQESLAAKTEIRTPDPVLNPYDSSDHSLGPSRSGIEAALDANSPRSEISREATELTLRHFRHPTHDGRRSMRLYAPLYLSNFCINHCLYCSFRFPHELDRVHLTIKEAVAQAEILRERGHRHILLVAGDFPKLTSTNYLLAIIRELVARGFSIAVEVAPQSTVAYARMARAGARGVTLYQETYQEELYSRYHPRGTKVWFDWRLEGPERAAEAGMSRIGLGILLGLADPLLDIRCLIRHGRYLLDRFPAIRLAFSLPRIHEAPDGFEPPYRVDDETLVRLYCALRLAFPSADLVLSTREPAELRDRLAAICITQMSAGSCTSPGGYGSVEIEAHPGARQQFPVYDSRSVGEVAATLQRAGFHLSWES